MKRDILLQIFTPPMQQYKSTLLPWTTLVNSMQKCTTKKRSIHFVLHLIRNITYLFSKTHCVKTYSIVATKTKMPIFVGCRSPQRHTTTHESAPRSSFMKIKTICRLGVEEYLPIIWRARYGWDNIWVAAVRKDIQQPESPRVMLVL